MKRVDRQFRVRVPEDLKEEIDQLAEECERTVNSQIVYLLKRAVRAARQADGASA